MPKYKVPLVEAMLHHYQYVLLMDTDMLIGNNCISLSPLIKNMGNADVLLSEDLYSTHIQGKAPLNTGAALFRQSAFSQF